jgi:hypothetical protein
MPWSLKSVVCLAWKTTPPGFHHPRVRFHTIIFGHSYCPSRGRHRRQPCRRVRQLCPRDLEATSFRPSVATNHLNRWRVVGGAGNAWRHGLVECPHVRLAFYDRADVRGSAQWPGLLERILPRLDMVTVFEITLEEVHSPTENHRLSTTCSPFHRSLCPSLR